MEISRRLTVREIIDNLHRFTGNERIAVYGEAMTIRELSDNLHKYSGSSVAWVPADAAALLWWPEPGHETGRRAS